jgi:hypothetical protein
MAIMRGGEDFPISLCGEQADTTALTKPCATAPAVWRCLPRCASASPRIVEASRLAQPFDLSPKFTPWSTEACDTPSALGSSETNGPSPFILRTVITQRVLRRQWHL